jgi:hypothetical protein
MPKVEYGINFQRYAELQAELESLKIERMNAFIDGNNMQVEYYSSRIAEVTSELESMNGLAN